MENELNIAYQKSLELLKNNSSKYGVLAATKTSQASQRNYDSIFGRDASICVLGMTMTDDKQLILTAKRSLETLARAQADNGQIPFYTKPEKEETWHYYLGSIDSTLWWLLAIKMYEKNTGENIAGKFDKQIIKAINWLECHEHPNFYLLTQNEISDWADLMPRSGFVLYSNALWYWLKKEYNLKNTAETKKYFNYIFDPESKIPKYEKFYKRLQNQKLHTKDKTPQKAYYSFVSHMQKGTEIDIYANILTCQVGLANKQKKKELLKYFLKEKANQPYPIKTVLRPIAKNDKLWREYMTTHNLNLPYQYHNGGIWPYIGGFWVLFVASIDKKLAKEELLKLAELNKKNNWQFNEWFHGKTSRAMGMPQQSWNAAMYILAYKYLYK